MSASATLVREEIRTPEPARRPRRTPTRPRGEVLGTVSVVIPTLNEAQNLPWVLERLPAWIDEVVLVDGRSTDATVAVARALRPDVKVVLETTPGKGAALRAGFAAATGDAIIMIDADGSMDPGEMGRFVQRLEQGCDLVKGSRFTRGGGTTDMTAIRRWGNAALTATVNALFGSRFTDLCYGYCAMRRRSLGRLDLRSDGFEIETELITRAVREGLRIGEVPSFETPRLHGESNLDAWRDGRRVLRTLLGVRASRARRHVLREELASV